MTQRREDFNEFRNQLDASSSPLEVIKDFFRSMADRSEENHLKGCIIANSLVELTFIDEDLELEAVNILKDVEQMFTEAIRKAQRSNSIANSLDAEILGKYLITFWCGLNSLCRMYRTERFLWNKSRCN